MKFAVTNGERPARFHHRIYRKFLKKLHAGEKKRKRCLRVSSIREESTGRTRDEG